MKLHTCMVIVGLWCGALLLSGADVPADNPYAPAYAAMARLSEADRKALAERKPLSAEAAPVVGDVRRALSAGGQAKSVDWGINYEAGSEMSFPFITGIRNFPRLVFLAAGKPAAGEVVDLSLDVFALARHAGRENMLITWMVERVLEQQATAWVEKKLFGVVAG